MRPVSSAFPINQPFGGMKTAGVVGNINASQDTVEYYVGRYGNYQPFGHAGCDIACPEGTPVHAIAAGTVLWADWGTKLPGDDSWGPSGYFRRWALYKSFPGIVTVLQHDGWIGVYAHLSAATLNPGDRVREGQQIGLSGGTGGVAPHLHVEALIDLNYTTGGGLIYGRTNPEPFFGAAAIAPQDSTIKELDWFDMADEAALRKVVDAALEARNPWAYKNANLERDDAYALLRATRTYVVKNNAELAALKGIVGQLAKAQGVAIDYTKIDQIVKDNLAAGVSVDISVNGK